MGVVVGWPAATRARAGRTDVGDAGRTRGPACRGEAAGGGAQGQRLRHGPGGGVDLSRGLRLNSADHALEAAVEGAEMLLALELLAADDIRNRRLVAPFDIKLRSKRAFYFVCPRAYEQRPHVQAFRAWIKAEMAAPRLAATGQDLGGN